jgi:hypothetical protein
VCVSVCVCVCASCALSINTLLHCISFTFSLVCLFFLSFFFFFFICCCVQMYPVVVSLRTAAEATAGLSGRVLRKLPFIALTIVREVGVSAQVFMDSLLLAIAQEKAARGEMGGERTSIDG